MFPCSGLYVKMRCGNLLPAMIVLRGDAGYVFVCAAEEGAEEGVVAERSHQTVAQIDRIKQPRQ